MSTGVQGGLAWARGLEQALLALRPFGSESSSLQAAGTRDVRTGVGSALPSPKPPASSWFPSLFLLL